MELLKYVSNQHFKEQGEVEEEDDETQEQREHKEEAENMKKSVFLSLVTLCLPSRNEKYTRIWKIRDG